MNFWYNQVIKKERFLIKFKEDEFMKKMKKDNKGFTLVELIVVIVILAILAAILVPALLGYIDKAKQQQIVLNAKSALTAAQAEMSSQYAKGKAPSAINKQSVLDTADVPTGCSELVIACKAAYDADNVTHDAYTINYVKYTENGKTIIYDGTSWDKNNTKPTNASDDIQIKPTQNNTNPNP